MAHSAWANGIPADFHPRGYTGEDGFENLGASQADTFARALLAQPEVAHWPGARNSLRLEAGLCLYGNDIDTTTTPVEAASELGHPEGAPHRWCACGRLPGADKVLAQPRQPATLARKRVGLVALERVPVREHTELQGEWTARRLAVTSGLLGPT